MVNNSFFVAVSAFLLSLASAASLCGGEFTASVSSTQVHLSDSFTLNLTLSGTSAKENPAISELIKYFLIHSQQHSTNTTIVNGKVSSNITWKLSLTPKVEGVIQIPSISVNTAEGVLATQPISIQVVKGSAAQGSVDNLGLKILTKVSNASPYKHEPFVYTVTLTSKQPLYNLERLKVQIDDAIVEPLEEPKLEERVIGGVVLNVVEFNYLITPLKAGTLTIPAMALQGSIPQRRGGQPRSLFGDDRDPFAFMRGFDHLKPFVLMTEEVRLHVLPPVPEVSPWLPAKTMTLEERWAGDQTLRVGEPLSRGFLIKADGLKASQLPHLEPLQGQGAMFKVYADKPEEQEKMLHGVVNSVRKEHYTLIPQEAGTWTLPEISVSWWDSVRKEKRIATIPARTVSILPALLPAASTPQDAAAVPAALPTSQEPLTGDHPIVLLYAVIAVLTCSLAAALLWGFTLHRKIGSLTKDPSPKPAEPPKPKKPVSEPVHKVKREKLPGLNPT